MKVLKQNLIIAVTIQIGCGTDFQEVILNQVLVSGNRLGICPGLVVFSVTLPAGLQPDIPVIRAIKISKGIKDFSFFILVLQGWFRTFGLLMEILSAGMIIPDIFVGFYTQNLPDPSNGVDHIGVCPQGATV